MTYILYVGDSVSVNKHFKKTEYYYLHITERKRDLKQTNSVNYYMHTQVNIDICRCLFNAFTEKEKNSNFVCRLLASLFIFFLFSHSAPTAILWVTGHK